MTETKSEVLEEAVVFLLKNTPLTGPVHEQGLALLDRYQAAPAARPAEPPDSKPADTKKGDEAKSAEAKTGDQKPDKIPVH